MCSFFVAIFILTLNQNISISVIIVTEKVAIESKILWARVLNVNPLVIVYLNSKARPPPMKTTPTSTHLFFAGRDGDPRLGQWAQPTTLGKLSPSKQETLVLIGAPDDTGVTLNRGRAGAKEGPDALRQAFYKFAWPKSKKLEKTRWLDAGNILVSKDILATHENAFNAASLIATSGATVVAIGGGHDFAAPHILGTLSTIGTLGATLGGNTKKNAKKNAKKTPIFGVINVDPHLDVREFENKLPNSGTPFRQILESGIVKGPNLIQFGAREGRNSRAHFEFCEKQKVAVHELDVIRQKGDAVKQFGVLLKKLSTRCDSVALTIDMDCCADIEGVSAAPVIGFSPWELCQFARMAGANKKIALLELAEIAPPLDSSGRAARIGAEVLFHFLLGRLSI
jgi:formiminoglutamase